MNSYFESFLKYIRYERNYTDRTVETYRDDLRNYEAFVTAFTGEAFDALHIDIDLARAWMADMGQRGLSVAYIKRQVSALRSFTKYLRRQKLIDNNPLALLRLPQMPKPLPVWVNEEQMDALIDDFDYGDDFVGVRDHLIITMLYSTGMRRSEAAALRDLDLDFSARQIRVFGKGRKQRLVPFGEELEGLLHQYIERRNNDVENPADGHLLVSPSGRPLSPVQVTAIVHRYLQYLPTLARKGAHVLRHSFATNMLGQGADLMTVKELLGHASLQSTQVYTHLTPKDLLDNYKAAHPRAK